MRTRTSILAGLVLAAVGVAVMLVCSRLAVTGAAPSPVSPAASGPRPNVVLVSLDTVRPDHLGCYGYARDTSPALDSYAEQAVVFENVRAQAPWTLPSHMSLLTSLRPSRNGVEDLNQQLSPGTPLLAELLQSHGYRTAALVNNGQMKPHWGFARGFGTWREFEVDTPEGACENITREAVRWLQAAPPSPFFLFLHYFDAHDPYSPPSPYRERFGVTLSAAEISRAVWDHRLPGRDIADPQVLDQIVAAYDGEIARLDASLSVLLDAIPANTLVVLFSDHGEAFEEHGWTTHGATLYEEEVRVMLMVRTPQPGVGRRVSDPVMLLDVAPTILGHCGVALPAHYEGIDLRAVMAGGAGPQRLHFSETKRVLEGRILKAVAAPPAKLIYSLGMGAEAYFTLPDETSASPAVERSTRERLADEVRTWMRESAYGMVHVRGRGRHEVTLTMPEGAATVYVPLGIDLQRDSLRVSKDGRRLSWECYPDRRVKALFFEPWPAATGVTFDVVTEHARGIAAVFVASSPDTWMNPDQLPFRFPDTGRAADPFMASPFEPDRDGVYIRPHRAEGSRARSPARVQLDENTLRQLRSLGYVQ